MSWSSHVAAKIWPEHDCVFTSLAATNIITITLITIFSIIAITIIIYVIISIIINITNVFSKDMANKARLSYILPSTDRPIVHLTREIGLVDFKSRGETGIALNCIELLLNPKLDSTAVSIFVDILVYMFVWIY